MRVREPALFGCACGGRVFAVEIVGGKRKGRDACPALSFRLGVESSQAVTAAPG